MSQTMNHPVYLPYPYILSCGTGYAIVANCTHALSSARAPSVRAVQGDPEQRARVEAGAQVLGVLLVAALLRQRLLQRADRDAGALPHLVFRQQVRIKVVSTS